MIRSTEQRGEDGDTGSSDGGKAVDGKRARTITAAVTLAAMLLVVAALLFIPVAVGSVDSAGGSRSKVQRVSPAQLEVYCPSHMGLDDSGEYGDAQFRASTGDMASSSRYGAFGSVYRATVGQLTNGSDADESVLKGSGSDMDSVKTFSSDANDDSKVLTSKLLDSKSGTGSVASVGAWATKGDLQGISASPCLPAALKQHFLLPSTASGNTQQLVVANMSSKATSVQIQVHSTKSSGPVALSTGSRVNVAAHGEVDIELSAAAPKQDGLFVMLESEDAPVAAVVRSVSLSGLQPKGSDYAMPLAAPSRHQFMPAVIAGDNAGLSLYGTASGTVSVSWVSQSGQSHAKTVNLTAGKVAMVDLGEVPDHVEGVSVDAEQPVSAQVRMERSVKDGHADFAFVPSAVASGSSAVAIPDSMSGTMSFINTSSSDRSVVLRGFDADGKSKGTKNLRIGGHAATSVEIKDMDDGTAFVKLEGGHDVVWGVHLKQGAVDAASLADVAYLPSTALEPQHVEIQAKQDGSVVR